jgi:hypothetical protein
VKRVSGNDDGIITAAQGDIATPTDGFADNSRLYLPLTAFNRFAVTREINDGLLAPRFAPSQRAWETEKTACYYPRYRDNEWKLHDPPHNGCDEIEYDS